MLWCCIYVILDTKSEQKMDKIPISCKIWVPMDNIRIKTEQPKFVRISCSRISIPFIPKWSLWKGDLGTFNGSHNPKSVTYRFLVNPVTTLIYIYIYIYIYQEREREKERERERKKERERERLRLRHFYYITLFGYINGHIHEWKL